MQKISYIILHVILYVPLVAMHDNRVVTNQLLTIFGITDHPPRFNNFLGKAESERMYEESCRRMIKDAVPEICKMIQQHDVPFHKRHYCIKVLAEKYTINFYRREIETFLDDIVKVLVNEDESDSQSMLIKNKVIDRLCSKLYCKILFGNFGQGLVLKTALLNLPDDVMREIRCIMLENQSNKAKL